MKITLKKVVNRVRDVRLMLKPPRGVDLFRDLRRYSGIRFRTVFDVGAHKGESALSYLRNLPEAAVYSFEPVCTTFKELGRATGSHRRMRLFNLALCDRNGSGEMAVEELSERSHLRSTEEVAAISQPVELRTLDDFCVEHNVREIDFLKIDTEGADLDVLKGAEQMISNGSIKMIQVESGMNRGNTTHVPFASLTKHLEDRGYSLFGLYEQHGEKQVKFAFLRRVNAVFISRAVAGATDHHVPIIAPSNVVTKAIPSAL